MRSFDAFPDLLMEPLAPVLDFWVFEEKEAPLQNYLGWTVVALFFTIWILFVKSKNKWIISISFLPITNNIFSVYY